ncbi:hypothetical protein [Pyruvatibacter sp.]
MTFVLATSPAMERPILRAVDLPPVGEAANLQPPNVLTGPGVSAGAPYTVVVNGDVYLVSRNGGGFSPAMCRFSMLTEIGKLYRFQIFEAQPIPSSPTKFVIRKSDDINGFVNSVQAAELEASIQFAATATTTYVGVSPTNNVTGSVQFARPECRLVA